MKRKFMLFAAALAMFTMSIGAQAGEQVVVRVKIIKPTTSGPQRNPVVLPEVYIDGYVLTFDESCVGDTLQLVQNGVVVYSAVITSDEVELPATLEGEFELQIIHGNWLFYGDIEL